MLLPTRRFRQTALKVLKTFLHAAPPRGRGSPRHNPHPALAASVCFCLTVRRVRLSLESWTLEFFLANFFASCEFFPRFFILFLFLNPAILLSTADWVTGWVLDPCSPPRFSLRACAGPQLRFGTSTTGPVAPGAAGELRF